MATVARAGTVHEQRLGPQGEASGLVRQRQLPFHPAAAIRLWILRQHQP